MYCLIAAEAAIFTIFVVAYIFYLGKSLTRTHAARGSGVPDLLHHLPALQQPDDSLCREALRSGSGQRASRLLVVR